MDEQLASRRVYILDTHYIYISFTILIQFIKEAHLWRNAWLYRMSW